MRARLTFSVLRDDANQASSQYIPAGAVRRVERESWSRGIVRGEGGDLETWA